MRIYISGKIGEEVISDATRQKFERAEKMLQEKGYDVVNPTARYIQEAIMEKREEVTTMIASGESLMEKQFDNLDYRITLGTVMMLIRVCDAIYMLDDFPSSPGARAELSTARAMGLKRIFQNEYDARLDMYRDWSDQHPEYVNANTDTWQWKAHDYIEEHLDEHYLPL